MIDLVIVFILGDCVGLVALCVTLSHELHVDHSQDYESFIQIRGRERRIFHSRGTFPRATRKLLLKEKTADFFVPQIQK